MSPVDLYIPTYPDDYIGDAQEMRARRRQIIPRGKMYVALCYLFVITVILLWLLYILIPYYLSGYDQLSSVQIKYSHLALTDYTDYPLYTPGSGYFVVVLAFTRECIGFPIILGLLVELVYKWPSYSWRTNAVKIACLLFVVGVVAAGWEAADKIGLLLYG